MLKGKKVALRPFEREDLKRAHEFENDVELRLLADYQPPVPFSFARMEAKFDKRPFPSPPLHSSP